MERELNFCSHEAHVNVLVSTLIPARSEERLRLEPRVVDGVLPLGVAGGGGSLLAGGGGDVKTVVISLGLGLIGGTCTF